MSYRLASPKDFPLIHRAVCKLYVDSPEYRYSRRPSLRKTVAMIDQARDRGDAYIVAESILLIVSYGVAWHSHDTCLEEVLVLALTPNAPLLQVTKAMEDIARARRVDAIIAHDSSLNQRMGSLYKRAGYRSITTTYYKELQWDNGSPS